MLSALKSQLRSLPPHQQQQVINNLHKLPEREQAQLLDLIEEVSRREARTVAQGGFLDFVKVMWPGFIMGRHHKIMAEKFEAVARGDIKRLAIAIAPRHTKSEFASYLLPAWYLGKYPDRQIMEASHTADLAIGFGRKVRNLIDTAAYQEIFPGVTLQADSKSAGRWGTNKGGVYNALGVGGAAAGKGADLFVIDDPFSEADIKTGNGAAAFEQVWDWYMTGPRQRLQPGAGVIVVQTRWGKGDLIGRLLDYAAKNPDADQWDYIEFPAIMPSGTPLWPEFWPIEELLKIKATIAPQFWNAQFMQSPTGEEGALIKREWWQNWEPEKPPKDLDYIIISMDCAQEAHNRADYNALVVFGIFQRENADGVEVTNVILLDAWKERMEFPELKKAAYAAYKKWEPDTFIVEKKSNGAALYQEMRSAGIPVSEYTPGKGSDKIARVNSISDMFSSGLIWAPKDRLWAMEVIDEVAEFPNSDHDDFCFIAGTKILMADGTQKNIEQVQAGDRVMTPHGSQIVERAFCSGRKEIWELVVGKAHLLGTGDHPIHSDVGWMPIDSISQARYTTVFSHGGFSRCAKKLSYSTIIGITDTLIRPTGHIARTLAEVGNYYTELFGNTIMGKYLKDSISTIKTGVQQITNWVIWNVYLRSNIGWGIAMNRLPAEKHQNRSPTWLISDLALWHGMVLQKVRNGIANTHMSRYIKKGAYLTSALTNTISYVSGVATRLQLRWKEQSFALRRARFKNLDFVEGSTSSNTHTTALVYNLTVANERCYFANSVLVHNCDAVSQALIRIRKGGFIRLPTDEEDDERPFRSHKHQRYY